MVYSQRVDICPELKCCKWNELIKIPTCLLRDWIPESQTVLLYASSRVCPMVSVRGKTPIPMTPWGYSRHTWSDRLWTLRGGAGGKFHTFDDMRHRREPKQPGLSPTSPVLSNTVKFLICPSVAMYPIAGLGRCVCHPLDSTKSRLCRLV